MQELVTKMKYKISMSGVGNSLDNREAEFLNRINTSILKIDEIKELIKECKVDCNEKYQPKLVLIQSKV
jgi:hypothetical protein